MTAPSPADDGREPATMSVANAAVWAMAGQYLSFAIQFLTSVIISRFFLTPPEVGLFSIALAAAMVVSVLQDFGLTRYIAGLPRIDAEAQARCSSVALTFSFVVAGLIAALALPMAHAYHQPALAPMLLIIAGSYLFVPLAVVPMALMARTMSFRCHFSVNVGGALAQGIVALMLAAMGFSAFALAWATLANGAARGIIAQWMRPALPWPLRFDGVKPIVTTGSRLTFLYGWGALGTRTPDMIVGKLLGLLAVGLYSRATSLSDQFRMLMSGAIGSVFFPAFARIRDRGDPLGPAYARVIAGYTAIIWPGMAGLALAAAPVVRLLYGAKWMAVAPLLSTISLTEIFLVMLPMHTDLSVLMGRTNRLIGLYIVDTAVSLSLLAAGSLLWGTQGAAFSRLIYGAFWVLLYGRFIHGIAGFNVRAVMLIYAKSAIACLAALTPLGMTYLFWAGPYVISTGLLFANVVLGGCLWLATMIGLHHPALDDLIGLVAHLPGGRKIHPLLRTMVRV
ncbi:O-antigen/teichoic acid export membrane protein [Novosphingobium sp. SG751A]|uniref:oligosaccharide flippase family protein n=1 Tax=Novosphingobium sp. SG751A TaxID=2587000 RepID=UPI0020A6C108|nr:oligosaccharide flippase family protein [Novosphingobium sp. SG751A]NOW44796.1 O-antigen/teichoic acid export membrane protein [Novosphingobium sp. SG751A]